VATPVAVPETSNPLGGVNARIAEVRTFDVCVNYLGAAAVQDTPRQQESGGSEERAHFRSPLHNGPYRDLPYVRRLDVCRKDPLGGWLSCRGSFCICLMWTFLIHARRAG
jgi:hypothetical protein